MKINVVTVIEHGEKSSVEGYTVTPTYLKAQIESASTPYVVTSIACRDEEEAQKVVDAFNNAPPGSVDLGTVRDNIRRQ